MFYLIEVSGARRGAKMKSHQKPENQIQKTNPMEPKMPRPELGKDDRKRKAVENK